MTHVADLCVVWPVSVEENKRTKHRSPTPPQPCRSPEEIRRQLEQRRSASLRAQRAARRHHSPDQSDSLPPPVSETKRHSQHTPPASATPPGRTGCQNTSLSSPTLLRDRRLTASTPVVRIQRADKECDVDVIGSSEEGAGDAVGLQSSCPRLHSSPATVQSTCPSAQLSDLKHEAEQTDTEQVLQGSQTLDSSDADRPEQRLHIIAKQCNIMQENKLRIPGKRGRKKKRKRIIREQCNNDKNNNFSAKEKMSRTDDQDNFRHKSETPMECATSEPVELSTPRLSQKRTLVEEQDLSSSPLTVETKVCKVSQSEVVTELPMASEQQTAADVDHQVSAALPMNPRHQQSYRNSLPRHYPENLSNSTCVKDNQNASEETCGRFIGVVKSRTRSECLLSSHDSVRLTRSALAQSPSLKACLATMRDLPKKKKCTRSSLHKPIAKIEKSEVMQIEPGTEQLDEQKEKVEKTHDTDVHGAAGTDEKQESSFAEEDGSGNDFNIPDREKALEASLTTANIPREEEKEEEDAEKDQTGSPQSSASAESMTTAQVRYGRHIDQSALHCPSLRNKHGSDIVGEFDNHSRSNSGLSTDAGGLQSSAPSMIAQFEAEDVQPQQLTMPAARQSLVTAVDKEHPATLADRNDRAERPVLLRNSMKDDNFEVLDLPPSDGTTQQIADEDGCMAFVSGQLPSGVYNGSFEILGQPYTGGARKQSSEKTGCTTVKSGQLADSGGNDSCCDISDQLSVGAVRHMKRADDCITNTSGQLATSVVNDSSCGVSDWPSADSAAKQMVEMNGCTAVRGGQLPNSVLNEDRCEVSDQPSTACATSQVEGLGDCVGVRSGQPRSDMYDGSCEGPDQLSTASPTRQLGGADEQSGQLPSSVLDDGSCEVADELSVCGATRPRKRPDSCEVADELSVCDATRPRKGADSCEVADELSVCDATRPRKGADSCEVADELSVCGAARPRKGPDSGVPVSKRQLSSGVVSDSSHEVPAQLSAADADGQMESPGGCSTVGSEQPFLVREAVDAVTTSVDSQGGMAAGGPSPSDVHFLQWSDPSSTPELPEMISSQMTVDSSSSLPVCVQQSDCAVADQPRAPVAACPPCTERAVSCGFECPSPHHQNQGDRSESLHQGQLYVEHNGLDPSLITQSCIPQGAGQLYVQPSTSHPQLMSAGDRPRTVDTWIPAASCQTTQTCYGMPSDPMLQPVLPPQQLCPVPAASVQIGPTLQTAVAPQPFPVSVPTAQCLQSGFPFPPNSLAVTNTPDPQPVARPQPGQLDQATFCYSQTINAQYSQAVAATEVTSFPMFENQCEPNSAGLSAVGGPAFGAPSPSVPVGSPLSQPANPGFSVVPGQPFFGTFQNTPTGSFSPPLYPAALSVQPPPLVLSPCYPNLPSVLVESAPGMRGVQPSVQQSPAGPQFYPVAQPSVYSVPLNVGVVSPSQQQQVIFTPDRPEHTSQPSSQLHPVVLSPLSGSEFQDSATGTGFDLSSTSSILPTMAAGIHSQISPLLQRAAGVVSPQPNPAVRLLHQSMSATARIYSDNYGKVPSQVPTSVQPMPFSANPALCQVLAERQDHLAWLSESTSKTNTSDLNLLQQQQYVSIGSQF